MMFDSLRRLQGAISFGGEGLLMGSQAAETNITGGALAMYGKGAGPLPVVTATTTGVGAVVLPNTGGNLVVTAAVSVAAGLVAWGVLYARATR